MTALKFSLIVAILFAPGLALSGPEGASSKFQAKPTPKMATAQLRRTLRLQARGGGDQNADVYGECYPSSGEGGEDCSDFLIICAGGGGGSGKLPGGGYSCHAVE